MSTPAKSGKLPLAERRQRRAAARLFSVQALFQMETTGQTADSIVREFTDHRFGERFEDYDMAEGHVALFQALVDGAVNDQARIDQMTDRALVARWPIARIDPTLRALFRAAGAEFLIGDSPPKVIITEFLAVAQAFFPDSKETAFVNAVLDHMAREARPDAF